MITVLGIPQLLGRFAAMAAVGHIAGEAAVQGVAEGVADTARAFVAVATGETQESIEVTEEGVVAAGAALYLEFGTWKMAAQPFLIPAADAADDSLAVAGVSRVFGGL